MRRVVILNVISSLIALSPTVAKIVEGHIHRWNLAVALATCVIVGMTWGLLLARALRLRWES